MPSKPTNFQSMQMKHLSSFYFFLFFSLTTQTTWGQQTPDSTARPVDSKRYGTIVSDRINEVDEPERGPSLNNLLKKADEAFGKKNFYAAMKYYGFVLKAEPLHVESLKGYGEAAFAITSLDSAEAAFKRLVDHGLSPSPDYFPKIRLADVMFRKGKYPEALKLYNELATQTQTPSIPDKLKRKAETQLDLCLWAQGEGVDNPYIIKNDTCYLLDTANVNTKEKYSEYVATLQNDQLYFSAYRFDFKKDKSNPKRNTIKLLQADGTNGPLGPNHPMIVSETVFNDPSRQHTAHLSFNEAGNVAYYAQGDYLRDSADIRFDLYRRRMLADSTWGLPEKLNRINLAGYTTIEPSIGTLTGDKNETLFFVSNRPGGKGGKDIWFSRILGDSLTAPRPLTEVNTLGDDVSPYYHSTSNTLFFSTDSLKTLGGFDVYKTNPIKGGHWSKPEHMGSPINSSANDVFFVLSNDSQRGFFSSNRVGNTNYSEEGCCYDIYAVDFITRYKAIALNEITHQRLPYTSISIFQEDSNGKLTLVANPPVDANSSYAFDVLLNQQYVLIGKKDGFISDTLAIKTPFELWTREITDTLYLLPRLHLVASVYDEDTGLPVYGATTTFFDLGLREPLTGNFSSTSLKRKIDVLPENSNFKQYPLEFEHKYQVLASKEGYFAGTSKADSSEVVSTIGLVDGDTLWVNLYLHERTALEEYLPITLYFDNDNPKRIRGVDSVLEVRTDAYSSEMRAALLKNPKDPNYQDTILFDYQKTFVDYIRRKDDYKRQFAGVLAGQKKQEALDSTEYFFEKEVRINWDSFFSFSDKIDQMLQNGDTIILTLKGYASPLSNADYNYHLTNRRIASVYNHFMIFDGGTFTKYREKGGSNQLRFIREANGDGAAPPNMNRDPKNLRLSVYDYKVARERRVQIIGAKVSKGSKVAKEFQRNKAQPKPTKIKSSQ